MRLTPASRMEPSRRTWPDAVALREVLQNPATMLTPELDLCYATVAMDRNGFPLTFTGRFAVVFRLTLPGDVRVALRVFTSPDGSFGGDREARNERAVQSLTRLQSAVGDLLPPFVHLPRAVRVGDTWYPAQILPWADGEPLLSFVARNRANAPALRTLAAALDMAVGRLEAVGVSHGDLQHDNVLVSGEGGRVTLVDYDALYTPDLADFAPPAEWGHPNYQHPRRRATDYGAGADRFPLSVIRTGLLLLATAPDLWEQTGGDAGEGVLFSASDLAAPHQSLLFRTAESFAAHDAALAESLDTLRALCDEAPPRLIPGTLMQHISTPVTKRPSINRYPSRVTPTCEEEKTRSVSYTAPLYTSAFRREEAAHIRMLRAYLLVAPPVVSVAWLTAWDAGGTKWPFLAYLLVLLAALQLAYLYLAWGVKRQRDAMDLEYAKLSEAERVSAERAVRLSEKVVRITDRKPPVPDARQEREHLRAVLSHIPLSRSIGDFGVRAPVVRELRMRGIETAAHLWQRHGFLPAGIDPEQAALLRAWLGEIEARERERYARESNPVLALGDELARLAAASEKRAVRLAELESARESFPDASLAAFLQRLFSLPFRTA